MRCAVPSSKVGSFESASATAERDSGVEAVATGFAGAACGAMMAAAAAASGDSGAAVLAAGLLGATGEFWQKAEADPSIMVTAAMVIVRMSVSQMRTNALLPQLPGGAKGSAALTDDDVFG